MIYVTMFYLVLVAITNLGLGWLILLALALDWWIYQTVQIKIRQATEKPERKYWEDAH